MKKQNFVLFFVGLFLLCSFVIAQEPTPAPTPTTETKTVVAPPTSMSQAKEMFAKSIELEQEQKFDEAILHYNALYTFYSSQEKAYEMMLAVVNNIGGIYTSQGQYDIAIEQFKKGLELSLKLDDFSNIGQFYHKLGITYEQKAKIEDIKKAMKRAIYPEGKDFAVAQQVMISEGVYVRVYQIGDDFIVDRIQMSGRQDPYKRKQDQYTKIVNIRVKGDFDPTELLVPDSVEFLLQIRKKGYMTISKPVSMLPEMEYTQIDERMLAIPRQIEPRITEDFYKQDKINPDEISLTMIDENKVTGKPIQITKQEKFKPGHYQLTIRKQGYDPIVEPMTIFPGEGPFGFGRELKSKLRNIAYRIQSDFTALGGGELQPDEISLNGKPVKEDSVVKPGPYQLLIKKDGYEIISKNLIVEPDERTYFINEYMKSIPREFLYQITGDFQANEILTLDEITLNGKFVKYGESVKPDTYRVAIRKKGYDAINEVIVVKPESGPYVLRRMLNSTPRRIQHYLVAMFPNGQRLFPDMLTLNGKDVLGEESLKPGEYTLNVKRNGYKPIEKTIVIPPDDTPYVVKEFLDPKLRATNIQISQDIPHDNPDMKPRVTMLNEKTNETKDLRHGDQIPPESYVFKVEMDGYDPEVFKDVVMPSEEAYKITRRLNASQRSVVSKITAEYPDGETIIPDEIKLNNVPVGKDFKVKPGTHDLVILKEGYIPVQKQIVINANANEYILEERLITQSRLVNVRFLDSSDQKELSPDESNLGNQRIAAKSTITLKPGEYNLKAILRGYEPIDKKVTVPVGVKPHTFTEYMVPTIREVISDISGDFERERDKKLVPDIFTLNDMAVGEKCGVKPGTYNLIIQKEGYFPVIEKIYIGPDPTPYLLKHRLISKPRQLNVLIKSSFQELTIKPDTLILGTESIIRDGQNMKPGVYALLIKKAGHFPLTDEVTIEPSEKPYLLRKTLEASPVPVKYEIGSDFDEKLIIPDVITFNEKTIDQKASFIPGKYNLKIEKIGYNALRNEILIEPSDKDYIIKETLITIPREIDATITGDFPVGERIEAEVTLNTKDIRDTAFKPGKYQLDIQAPGYVSLKEEVIIQPAEEPYYFEKVLVTKPREMKEKISYDVKPPDDLAPYKITLAPVDKPKQEKVVKEGDLIKPNSYIMKIEKEAYEILETRKHIWPSETPILFDHQLIAKQVLLKINIVYNIDPPRDLPPYTVTLIDKITLFPRSVEDGKRIKPGPYYLDVQRPGYDFGPRQEMEILPSEQPYNINKKLIAKRRQMSFDMVDERTGVLVPAYQILVDGKPISFKDTFEPGSEFDLMIKFKKYKTVQKRTKIIPGEGPFVEKVQLVPLKRVDFSVREPNTAQVDNITYTFELFVDNQPVEEHLIEIEKGIGRIYYIVWHEENAKNFQVYGGPFFSQKAVEQMAMGPGPFNNLNINRLIEHLEKESAGEKLHLAALEILEKMIKRTQVRTMLRQVALTELDQLIQYIESWKDISQEKDRVRMKLVIESLETLKKST
jgi:hypothetical protein